MNRSESEYKRAPTLDAEIMLVSNLIEKKIEIPFYQRPYRWSYKNVSQLLLDVRKSLSENVEEYRIGSVIVHNENNSEVFDIVDGQQRITTIALFLKACKERGVNIPSQLTLLSSLKFSHSESKRHIVDNYDFINKWLDDSAEDLEHFCSYLLNNCSVLWISVTRLTDAFQVFDSQNGRGKPLTAYNLLKAYHIREVESRDDKKNFDQKWEDATQYFDTDLLREVIDKHLYLSRLWLRREEATDTFSKETLDEFKGVSLVTDYPYQNSLCHLYKGIVASEFKFKEKIEGYVGFLSTPFASIGQPIINGRPFFEYTLTYIDIYKILFLEDKASLLIGETFSKLCEFKKFYYMYCLNYGANPDDQINLSYPCGVASRVGDTYLRELYQSLVIALVDKFGDEALLKYYKILYRLVFINRIIETRVTFSQVSKNAILYFQILNRAKSFADLIEYSNLLKMKLRQQKGTFKASNKVSDRIVMMIKGE